MRLRLPARPFLLKISVLSLLFLDIRSAACAQNPADPAALSRVQSIDETDSSIVALDYPIADLSQTNLLTSLSDSIWIYHAKTRDVPVDQLPLPRIPPYHPAKRSLRCTLRVSTERSFCASPSPTAATGPKKRSSAPASFWIASGFIGLLQI